MNKSTSIGQAEEAQVAGCKWRVGAGAGGIVTRARAWRADRRVTGATQVDETVRVARNASVTLFFFCNLGGLDDSRRCFVFARRPTSWCN